MVILHFSDIHDNQRALNAVCSVAARWHKAHVAVTGDICKTDSVASGKYDDLPNPNVWLVRGNHDISPEIQFGHLSRATWRVPYIANPSNHVAVVGLDSELVPRGVDQVSKQLQSIAITGDNMQKKVLVVLHHRPYTFEKELILKWAKEYFPNITGVVLLHGHQHHPVNFYAEQGRECINGMQVLTSNVYSANTRFCRKKTLGCANLFIVREDGKITAETVFNHTDRASIDHCNEAASQEALLQSQTR